MALDTARGTAKGVAGRKTARGLMITAAGVGLLATGLVCAPAAMAAGEIPLMSTRSQSWIALDQAQPFFASILRSIGTPVTASNLQVMEAWARSEGSRSAYNPWNTTQRAPGCTVDSNGSTAFADAASSITAHTKQLRSLYPAVIAGFGSSDPERTVAAIVASPWASSHYGGASDFKKSLIWRVYLGLPASGWRPYITPPQVPGVVALTTVRFVKRRVVLRWSATPDNGAGIKNYEIAVRSRSVGSRTWRKWALRSVSGSTRSHTWSRLHQTSRYQLKIRARNAIGFGPWSDSIRGRTA